MHIPTLFVSLPISIPIPWGCCVVFYSKSVVGRGVEERLVLSAEGQESLSEKIIATNVPLLARVSTSSPMLPVLRRPLMTGGLSNMPEDIPSKAQRALLSKGVGPVVGPVSHT